MLFHHIVILALIQGLTEFLPVSSSAHLILAHGIIDDASSHEPWGAALTLDVAVHVGTLLSVLLYFRRDIINMAHGVIAFGHRGEAERDGRKLALHVALASFPVVIAGALLVAFEPPGLRDNVAVIGWATLVFGMLLWAADRFFPEKAALQNMRASHALGIGLAQALALVPGVSRSGVTMTAGRCFGLGRTEAARFSLLLSVVAISGAGTLQGWSLIANGDFVFGADVLLAALLAFASGWGAIALMMRWLTKATFTPFVVYRIALGVLLLGMYYTGYGF